MGQNLLVIPVEGMMRNLWRNYYVGSEDGD